MKAFPILRTIGTVLHDEAKLIKRLVNKTPDNNGFCKKIVGEPLWGELEEHIMLRDKDMDNGVVIKTEFSSDDEI